MLFANSNIFSKSSQRSNDDEHEQIPSNCPTPPHGRATPQPDPSDKRLPGIASSYFGQVGNPLHTSCFKHGSNSHAPAHVHSPLASHLHTSIASLATQSGSVPMGAENSKLDQLNGGVAALQLHTPPPSEKGSPDLPPTLSHITPLLSTLAEESSNKMAEEAKQGLRSPPASSASSFQKSSASVTPTSTSRSSNSSPPNGTRPQRRKLSGLDSLQSKVRTGAAQQSLSGVVSTPNILASHISNPGLVISPENDASTTLSSASPVSSPPPPAQSASSQAPPPPPSEHTAAAPSSEKKREGLTEHATPSREQNTPPYTPRSLSREAANATPPPTASRGSSDSVSVSKSRTSAEDATLGVPKGQLHLTITQGRGLRPSANPYLVCQYQWNEYISKGPRRDSITMDSSDDDNHGNVHSHPKGGIAMRREYSDSGRPMAIPMRSRQGSHQSISTHPSPRGKSAVTDPVWNHEAIFDVVGEQTEVDISVYDRSGQESFLGHVRFSPDLSEDRGVDKWLRLEPMEGTDPSSSSISGEIHVRVRFSKTEKRHFGPEDFQILKLIGKGTFGQVFQVRKRDTQRVYAMKVLSKKVVVQKKEVAHTVGERNILVRTAMTESPFIVGLKFSFQTPTDLYLVTDYMSGGELFWHLQKEGRFNETRAKFYIAELILALQHLHQHDIVYRDLKPENILLDANGHIALCDFGLSKANLTKDDTTNTFCGTTEYLAPEVLLDEHGYTKMVDFWSLGVLVFEMCCGWSPFYAEDTQQMYKNIAFGKVRFPRDALSTEGRNFVKGLLNRNPRHRLGANGDAAELKAHPFFGDVDWVALGKKNIAPPFKPRLLNETDTSNFDPEFTNALNTGSSLNARAAALASGIDTTATPISPTMQENFKGFTFVDESSLDQRMRRDDDDAMDEDFDGEGWELPSRQQSRGHPGDRMSGIQTAEGGIFNAEGFD